MRSQYAQRYNVPQFAQIASSHAGITLGEDGATHQTMEDIALMRAIPEMVVLN
ncbi:MAG: hypothetical protein IIT49_06215, partial [Clostridia bacterium]|nr:hypothetical protein [Clostridia bacterium]